MTYKEIKQVVLGESHPPTGRTKHTVDGQPIPTTYSLKIVKFRDEEGVYLLHFDALGNELTDTFHDTIEDALHQAEWEFQVKPDEWTSIDLNS